MYHRLEPLHAKSRRTIPQSTLLVGPTLVGPLAAVAVVLVAEIGHVVVVVVPVVVDIHERDVFHQSHKRRHHRYRP